MIELLLQDRREELDAQLTALASLPSGQRKWVEDAEYEVGRDAGKAIRFDSAGTASVAALGRVFGGGRFAVKSLRELRAQARQGNAPGRARLSVLCGANARTDIGLLQASAAPNSLFQVASQFNCLEAPGPALVWVVDYFGDSTQGPRAAISAFPGTLVRHYAAPASDGSRFIQTDGHQLNLLEVALAGTARVQGGYLMTQNIPDRDAAARALEDHFEDICVGVQEDLEVVLGGNWLGAVKPGTRIAQVFTSSLAAGYGNDPKVEGASERICRSLLRAAYLGTLLAAAATQQKTVVLTLIGGGVFGNPHPLIWESILWALDELDATAGVPLEVVLNGREVESTLGLATLTAGTQARGGVVVRV